MKVVQSNFKQFQALSHSKSKKPWKHHIQIQFNNSIQLFSRIFSICKNPANSVWMKSILENSLSRTFLSSCTKMSFKAAIIVWWVQLNPSNSMKNRLASSSYHFTITSCEFTSLHSCVLLWTRGAELFPRHPRRMLLEPVYSLLGGFGDFSGFRGTERGRVCMMTSRLSRVASLLCCIPLSGSIIGFIPLWN